MLYLLMGWSKLLTHWSEDGVNCNSIFISFSLLNLLGIPGIYVLFTGLLNRVHMTSQFSCWMNMDTDWGFTILVPCTVLVIIAFMLTDASGTDSEEPIALSDDDKRLRNQYYYFSITNAGYFYCTFFWHIQYKVKIFKIVVTYIDVVRKVYCSKFPFMPFVGYSEHQRFITVFSQCTL